nr:E-beta-farnesene synthase [Tanacetum cinerariifolium]
SSGPLLLPQPYHRSTFSSSGIQSDLTSQIGATGRKHEFHPRPDSPLYLPNEEPVLGYLKFSAKGTKREVFGIPIPGSLITADIQEALYCQEYSAKVAKHRRYLAGKIGSDSDSPAPKPTKPARKPKSTVPKAPPRPSVSKPVTSAQPEPKSTPAKTQGKKRKPTTEMSDKPSKATKSRHGFVSKQHKPISTQKSVDESVAEDVPAKEPQVNADMQRAFEESLKSMYDVPRGSLPPVVIREPEFGKYQLLLEVLRKGKAKRPTSTPTGSSGHDESSCLYAELGISDSKEESQKIMPGADAGGQGEDQAGPDPGAQAEGQAGLDPDPGNARADEQPMPSPVVYAGSDRKHMDLDVADVSPQPLIEKMDEGFTTMVYPKVQENLSSRLKNRYVFNLSKASPIIDLTLRPESPKVHQQFKATSTDTTTTTTTTTLPPPPYQQQSTAEAMMMKRIDWAMQAPLWNRFNDLPKADMKEILHQRMWESDSYKSHEDHMQLYKALEKSMNHDQSEELAKDLAKARKKKKKSRESPKMPPGSPPHQPPPPPPPAGPSGASGAPGASGSSQVPPSLPPPPSTNKEGPSKGSATPSSSKTAASAEYQAWTTTDIRLRPSISLTPADLQMDDDMAHNKQEQSSDDEDIKSAHIPKVNLRQDWWKPLKEERPATPDAAWSISSSDVPVLTNNWASALASNYSPPPEDSLLAQTDDIATFMDWFCKSRGITELKPQDLEGPAFEIVKVFHPDGFASVLAVLKPECLKADRARNE